MPKPNANVEMHYKGMAISIARSALLSGLNAAS
jgi:hypothetical protein